MKVAIIAILVAVFAGCSKPKETTNDTLTIQEKFQLYLDLMPAGGIYLDTAGRETAKYISLHKSGVRIGAAQDLKVAAFFFVLMSVIALWVLIYALWFLAKNS